MLEMVTLACAATQVMVLSLDCGMSNTNHALLYLFLHTWSLHCLTITVSARNQWLYWCHVYSKCSLCIGHGLFYYLCTMEWVWRRNRGSCGLFKLVKLLLPPFQ